MKEPCSHLTKKVETAVSWQKSSIFALYFNEWRFECATFPILLFKKT